MMTLQQFKDISKAKGMRDKIKPVDNLLGAYNTAFATAKSNNPPPDFAALLRQLRQIRAACNSYTTSRPGSERAAGVEKLQDTIDLEESVLDLLATASASTNLKVQGKSLMQAQETQLENQRRHPEFKAYIGGLMDFIKLAWEPINTRLGCQSKTTDEGRALVVDDIEQLKTMSLLEITPGVIRVMLKGILAARNVQQISPAIFVPGAKYNQTRTAATPKYTVNHSLFYDGGTKNRLGAIVHELTHVAVAEAYNNTVLMLAVPRDATDDEWIAISRKRRASLESLKEIAQVDTDLNKGYFKDESLVMNIIAKCDYALEAKIGIYLSTFKAQIEATEGVDFIPRVTNLISQRGLGSELIEYDSVINQMLIWCWMHHVDQANPVYLKLAALAAAEMATRARQIPKPPKPVKPAVAWMPRTNLTPKLRDMPSQRSRL